MTVQRTSVEAFHEISSKGLLSPRRLEILEVLSKAKEPMTYTEIFRENRKYITTSQSNTGARINELVEMGVVEVCAERECKITKMNVRTYRATGNLPVKFIRNKELTKTEILIKMTKLLIEMSDHLDSQGKVPEKWVFWKDKSRALIKEAERYRTKKKGCN